MYCRMVGYHRRRCLAKGEAVEVAQRVEDPEKGRGAARKAEGKLLTRDMMSSWLAKCVLHLLQPKILSEVR